MIPENVVDRLLPPTESFFEPRKIEPAPSIEPAVMPAVVRSDRSMVPAAPLMRRAVPPVLEPSNSKRPLLVMVALPAVLKKSKNSRPLLVMVALPAVLELKKLIEPVLVRVAPPAVLEVLKSKQSLPVLVRVALRAVLEVKKFREPPALLVMVALPPLMTMPAPLKIRMWPLVKV